MKHLIATSLVTLFAFATLVATALTPVVAQGPVVRAMSYNIRLNLAADGEHAWPKRRHRVASIIRFHRPDVVGLQEALLDQLEDLAFELPTYARIGVGREDGASAGEFSAILYRTDTCREIDSGTYWLSETPEIPGSVGWDAALPRIVTWARLEHVSSSQEFFHVNTHFDHMGEEARAKSAELIVARMDSMANGLPVIFTGDVNAIPTSPPYTQLSSALVDARIASASPPHGPEGTFSGFVASPDPMRRIDYVFVSPGLTVLRFATLAEHWNGSHGSDHLPVLADVALPVD